MTCSSSSRNRKPRIEIQEQNSWGSILALIEVESWPLLFKTDLLQWLTERIIDFTYLLLASNEKCQTLKAFSIQMDGIV